MRKYICETCGTQYPELHEPPAACAICEDERQFVGWDGQRWTDLEALRRTHHVRLEEQGGLLALGVTPAFAIDQRALLLQTGGGNILWECLPLIDDAAIAAIEERGGLDRIIVSHPHFYASMVEWSDAFGGVPITLHEADQRWIQRPHPAIEFWSGNRQRLSADVELVRCGGHFEGSTALHWSGDPGGGGALFSGDALQVARNRRQVSFMYSYPNLVPMRTGDVIAMRERLAGYEFENVFGYTWGLDILGEGRRAVDASFERHLSAVTRYNREPVKLAVFGARGQVGRRIVDEALKRGHQVTAVVRDRTQVRELPGSVAARVGDARDPDTVAALGASADVVIGATRPAPGQEHQVVPATLGLLQGVARTRSRLLVIGGAATLNIPGTRGRRVLDDPRFLPPSARPIAEASAAQHALCLADTYADWAYLSPPAELTTGGVSRGEYRMGGDELLVDPDGRSHIAIEDFVSAALDEAERGSRHRERFTVGY